MADLFSNNYDFNMGMDPTTQPMGQPTGQPTGQSMDLFQPGLYPVSMSGTMGQMGQIGQNFLNQANPAINNMMNWNPAQMEAPTQLSTDPSQLMRSAAPGVLQDVMNSMAGRRMMNSSVASDALSTSLQGLGTNAMQMANTNAGTNQQMQFNTAQNNMNSQNTMPMVMSQLLGNLSGLGGTGAQLGNFSYSANPLAPYELLNNFVQNY